MKKNALKLTALLLIFVVLPSACGSTASSAGTSAPAPAAEAVEPASAPEAAATAEGTIVLSNLAGTTNTYDFFTDNYPALAGQTHVFQTAEFAEIYHYFLGGRYAATTGEFFSRDRSYELHVADGNYIFLIGGTWSEELQAAIGTINDVAKEYGVTAIYNFDPHLDGAGDDSVVNLLADPGPAPAEDADAAEISLYNTRLEISQRGDALANALYYWDDYTDPENPERGDLNGSIENGATRNDIKAPSLIIWNKNNPDSPVVGELTWTVDEANDTEAFRASVSSLFDLISTNKQADNINVTPGQYFMGTISARFGNTTSTTTQIDIYGDTVLTSSGAELMLKDWPLFPAGTEDTMFEVVTLQELEGILKSEGNYAIILGGLWCPNTHSTLRAVYDYALKFDLGKIYFFDVELDSVGNHGSVTLRNNNRTLSVKRYINLFNTYLTNIGLGEDELGSRFDYDFKNLVTSIELRKAEGRLLETDPADTPENFNADGTLTEAAKYAIYLTGGTGDGYSIYEKVPGSTEEHDPIANAAYVSRIHYPCFIVYNKDHVDANGNSAPVMGKFAQLWRSGGGNSSNPAPNTLGRLSTIYGRIYEYTEYAFGDSSKSTATHNSATNVLSPKTNELILESLGLTYDEDGFDPRGLDTPIVSRIYWVGLLEFYGNYTSGLLEAAIAQLQDQADSNDALKQALDNAKDVVAQFKAADQEAQSWIGERLNAPLEQTRLIARETIIPYPDYSEALVAAYNEILNAVK